MPATDGPTCPATFTVAAWICSSMTCNLQVIQNSQFVAGSDLATNWLRRHKVDGAERLAAYDLRKVSRKRCAPASPLADALERVGDRWTLLLVASLLEGP